MKNKVITVWFSCGVASAVAAKKTIELFGKDNEIVIVNTPIKEEHPDNRRFLEDVEKWLNMKIQIAVNPMFPDSSIDTVFNIDKYMSGVHGARCTTELKRKTRYIWEKENYTDYIVLGFTYEEIRRHDNLANNERCDLLPVLISLGLTKTDCHKIIENAGIKRPIMYDLGFKNSNCIGCVKSSSPKYWNLVRKLYPEIFIKRCEQSRELNCKLVKYKGERIFLDELPIDCNEGEMNTGECGIFCNN